jgi:lipoyl(octanoyl) transferase
MLFSTCEVRRLGLVDYQEAWDLQNDLAVEIGAGQRPPTLLLLEHPHTYTFGRRGHEENLLLDPEELERRQIRVYWVDRGGDVTYHGPGQLVGYPLLPLAPGGLQAPPGGDARRLPQADYIGYLRKLEQVLIDALKVLGVAAQRLEGLTGVWVPGEWPLPEGEGTASFAKIAAIGVKVDVCGVSRHGFALNVNPDMDYWQGIIGCGLVGHPVTSLGEISHSPPGMPQVMDEVVKAFGAVFHCAMIENTQP